MGLIICPECKSEISQYAESCPSCGFPVKSFMLENHINDTNKVFVCPLCARLYYGSKNKFDPLYLKCNSCNTTVIQTDEDEKELLQLRCKKYEKEYEARAIEIAKKYGNNQFSQDIRDKCMKKIESDNAAFIKERERKQQAEKQKALNTPKCPKCGSTAISAVSDVQGGDLIWTRTVNYCANCGHQWKPGKKKRSWF